MSDDNVIEFPAQKVELELKYAWKEASQQLRQADVASPLLDSRLLLQYVLGFTYEDVLVNARYMLQEEQIAAYAELIARRMKREPVSVIIGKKSFWKHDFITTAETLDPRPDSETLVDIIMKRYGNRTQPQTILDLGTGTGCLVLSLLHEFPATQAIAVDQSDAALHIATQNAANMGVADRVEFVQSDWFSNIEGKFDLIISNPPYIPSASIAGLEPEVCQYDPMAALDGGDDGLDTYRHIISQAADYLTEEGEIIVEIGANQQNDVARIFEENGFEVVLQEADLAGVIRCLLAVKKA